MPILDQGYNGLVKFYGSLVPHSYAASSYPDFAAMKADYEAFGRIRINTDFSTGTAFGDQSVNWLFRAWHDMCHIITDADFTLEGEAQACLEQLAQIHSHPGLTDEERERFSELVTIEVIGQANHFFQTGEFPKDQYQFTVNALACGKYRNYLAAIQTAITNGKELFC